MKCPTCNGKGFSFGHCNTGQDSSGHYWGDIKCLRCKGDGQVNDDMMQWISDGNAARLRRISYGKSLIEAAKEMGISPAELSSMEGGLKPFQANGAIYGTDA